MAADGVGGLVVVVVGVVLTKLDLRLAGIPYQLHEPDKLRSSQPKKSFSG